MAKGKLYEVFGLSEKEYCDIMDECQKATEPFLQAGMSMSLIAKALGLEKTGKAGVKGMIWGKMITLNDNEMGPNPIEIKRGK